MVNIPQGRLGPKCFFPGMFEGGLTQEEVLRREQGGWFEKEFELPTALGRTLK